MTNMVRLGDVIQLRKGKKATEVYDRRVNGSKPYIQIDEVRGIAAAKFAHDPRGVDVLPEDICIVWDGANAGTVGYGIEGLIGSTVARIRLTEPNKWDTRFLGRLLQSKFLELNEQAQGRGATIPHVDKSKLELIELPRIAINRQRHIADILDKADNIRRKREMTLAMTDEFLKSTFLERFGDPMTNPKGVPTAPIKELGRVVTGNTPPRANPANYGDAIEWIKSDNINTPEHFLTLAEEHLSETGKSIGRVVPAGSTLVTCIAGSPSVIGNAALADREIAFNQQINAVVPNRDTDPYFLYCQFLIGKKLVQAHSTNSMKGMVSKSAFQEINFLKPSYDVQQNFGRLFDRALKSRDRLRGDRLLSEQFFGSLATRAFRGEL